MQIPRKKTVFLASRLLRPINSYVIGSCNRVSQNLQLMMKIPVTLPNGDTQTLRILVDTGAEANLVRINLLPSHLFYGPNLLNFVAANGQSFGGGNNRMHFGF